MKSATCSLALLALVALMGAHLAQAQTGESHQIPEAKPASPVPSPVIHDLQFISADLKATPFDSIQVCWPYNVLIQPGNNYSMYIQAQDSVVDGLGWQVMNGTLSLFTTKSVSTNYPVSVVITLPPKAFVGLYVTSPLAEVTVNGWFTPPSNFVVAAAFTSSNIWIVGMDTPQVSVFSSGLGTIVVNGSFDNASVVSSGVSDIYLLGLKGTAVLNLAGAADVLVNASSDSAQILGQASGSSDVLYTNGQCSVDTPFLFGAPCQQIDVPVAPTLDPSWTCGLEVTGNFTCPPGGTLAVVLAASLGVLPLLSTPEPVPVLASANVIPNFPPIPSPVNPFGPQISRGAIPSLENPSLVSTVGTLPMTWSGGGGANPLSGSTNQAGTASLITLGAASLPGAGSAGVGGGGTAAGSRRRLRQATSGAYSTSKGKPQAPMSAYEGSLLQTGPGTTTVQTLPCYYNDVGGTNALQVFPDATISYRGK